MAIYIKGKPADPEEVYARSAEILSAASLPLIAALGKDIAGAKTTIALAQNTGGVVNHYTTNPVGPLEPSQSHYWQLYPSFMASCYKTYLKGGGEKRAKPYDIFDIRVAG